MKILRSLSGVIQKKVSFVSIFCFLLVFLFFSILMPVNILGADDETEETNTEAETPLDIFTNNNNNEGSQPSNFRGLSKFLNQMMVVDSSTGEIDGSARMGAIQLVGYVSDKLYEEQPASAMIWAQDQYNMIMGNASLTVSAANPNDSGTYSPGIGYNILQPVIGMWQWSRNIVYSFFIIILIFLAFLIILRRPMGGQEVITIANSLPSIAISIALVSFSYAICGLFIDAVYIGSNLVYNIMITQPNSPGYGLQDMVAPKLDEEGNEAGESVKYTQVLQPDDPQMSIWAITMTSNQKLCYEWGVDIENCQIAQYLFPAGANQYRFSGILKTIITLPVSLGNIINPLVELILLLAIFKTAFDLFMVLLNSYITLSVYPIIAPFIFMTTALPSRTHSVITNFIKSLGSASLNFIVIYALFLFLVILGNTSAGNTSQLSPAFNQVGQFKWAPPLLGYSNQQIFDITSRGDGGENIITTVVIFGLYMAIPNIVKQIEKVFEIPEMAAVSQTGKDIIGVGKRGLGISGSMIQKAFGEFFGGGKH